MSRSYVATRVAQWLVLGLFLVSLSGCLFGYLPDYNDGGECVGAGDVQVRWVFNSFTVCPVDAVTMEVELIDRSGGVITTNGPAIDCREREIYLRGVVCGDYEVRVRALDEFGDTTWLGGVPVISILGGRVNPITVNLQVAP